MGKEYEDVSKRLGVAASTTPVATASKQKAFGRDTNKVILKANWAEPIAETEVEKAATLCTNVSLALGDASHTLPERGRQLIRGCESSLKCRRFGLLMYGCITDSVRQVESLFRNTVGVT